jgi:hypothetical protein
MKPRCIPKNRLEPQPKKTRISETAVAQRDTTSMPNPVHRCRLENAILHCYIAFSAILSDRGLSRRGASSIHRVGKKPRHFLGSEHRTNELSWYFVLLTLGQDFSSFSFSVE